MYNLYNLSCYLTLEISFAMYWKKRTGHNDGFLPLCIDELHVYLYAYLLYFFLQSIALDSVNVYV